MKEEKALVIETLREWVKSSPYLIVLDYTGMKVAEFSELRGRLRKVGAVVKVVKNTLFKRAMGAADLTGLDKDLAGQTAIVAGGKDAPAAAKVIKTFKAEFTRPILRSGVMDGKILGSSELIMLADLPSMEVLRGRLLGALSAPAATLVRLLAEPGVRLARVVRTKADSVPAGGA
ncbi:MAG: 50S ribosomal protein L10 [Verrucomicrobia bacterium]|nr:50S ribosomal protein L10 [Verrucomicrobiota bacterium]